MLSCAEMQRVTTDPTATNPQDWYNTLPSGCASTVTPIPNIKDDYTGLCTTQIVSADGTDCGTCSSSDAAGETCATDTGGNSGGDSTPAPATTDFGKLGVTLVAKINQA